MDLPEIFKVRKEDVIGHVGLKAKRVSLFEFSPFSTLQNKYEFR